MNQSIEQDIIERINAFDQESFEAQSTDTQKVWDLLNYIKQQLTPPPEPAAGSPPNTDTAIYEALHTRLPAGLKLSWVDLDQGPWHSVLTHPTDFGHWYIVNVETGSLVRIGRVGARRVNFRDKAVNEARRRNQEEHAHARV